MTQPTARTEESAGPVDAARQQATKVGQHAGEKGSHLAGTAADQAKHVTAEAGRQARDLIGEARGQLGGQASAQQQKVADGLRSLVDELTSMALGAVLAGVLVGRLTRGAVEAASSTSSDSEGASGQIPAPQPAVPSYEPVPSPPAPPFSAPGLGVGPEPQGQV